MARKEDKWIVYSQNSIRLTNKMEDKEMYERAKQLAKQHHDGQTRWNEGEPYYFHLERVAEHLHSYRLKTIAFLHDILEDTSMTSEKLLEEGFSPRVVRSVIALTKREGEDYIDYLTRVSKDPLSVKVKLSDICDNMRDAEPGNRVEKYRLAKWFLENQQEDWR